MRIIFMGTPHFAVPTLEALVASQHDVVAVYTQPPRPAGRGQKEKPSPIHQLALKNTIPVFTPTSLKTHEAQAEYAVLKADIAVVVAYGLLLPQAILDAPRLGCINVHPSKLPRWRGAAPIQRTIMAGDTETSICIMQMDAGLDTGDILLEENFTIAPGTNASTLHNQLAIAAAPMVLRVLSGEQQRRTQASDGVTYAAKISKEECKLDLQQPAEKVLQQILGLSDTPGGYIEINGERIKIFAAEMTTDKNAPLAIICNAGILRPTVLQRAGGKRMGIEEFMKGFAL